MVLWLNTYDEIPLHTNIAEYDKGKNIHLSHYYLIHFNFFRYLICCKTYTRFKAKCRFSHILPHKCFALNRVKWSLSEFPYFDIFWAARWHPLYVF